MDLQVRIDMGLPSCDGCNFTPAAGTCPGSGHPVFCGKHCRIVPSSEEFWYSDRLGAHSRCSDVVDAVIGHYSGEG